MAFGHCKMQGPGEEKPIHTFVGLRAILLSATLAVAMAGSLSGSEQLVGNVTATASHEMAGYPGGVASIVNGLGLDTAGLVHTADWHHMWCADAYELSGHLNPNPGPTPGPAWVRFEFDKVYCLSTMWVWNFNESGHKEVNDFRMEDPWRL
jgi:hypothetical protein